MKVSLDIHDASLYAMNWDYFQRLKERYPKMKLSLFFIPWDHEFEKSLMRLGKVELIEKFKENLDWIRLYPHGLTHFAREFEKADRQAMEYSLKAIDEIMKSVGLPYQKGFCAPFWLWNQEVVDVLDEQGWWGAVDRNQPEMVRPKRFYQYSHSINEPYHTDKAKVWKLHGHMSLPSPNSIDMCLFNLLQIPNDAQWHFIDDFVEEKK